MKLTGIGLAVAVIAGLAVGSPAVAADSPAALQARKKAADSLVHARTAALGRATDAISASHSMGPDQAVVISAFNNAASGLQQLDAKIQADTTIAAVRADTAKIFSDYRVYALVLPVGHMVRAVDVVDNLIAPALNQAAGMFETAITTRGLTSLQPTLDDMKAQLATAAQATSGLAARLEALTPAQWNASHEVLSSPRSSLDAARDALRKARQDGNTILAGLAHS